MSDFLSGYNTYDPKKEGYGNANQWRSTFRERMSLDEAEEYLRNDDPMIVMGLKPPVTLKDIKKKFRELALQWHPDKNPDNIEQATKRMQEIIAAYTILTNKFK